MNLAETAEVTELQKHSKIHGKDMRTTKFLVDITLPLGNLTTDENQIQRQNISFSKF